MVRLYAPFPPGEIYASKKELCVLASGVVFLNPGAALRDERRFHPNSPWMDVCFVDVPSLFPFLWFDTFHVNDQLVKEALHKVAELGWFVTRREVRGWLPCDGLDGDFAKALEEVQAEDFEAAVLARGVD